VREKQVNLNHIRLVLLWLYHSVFNAVLKLYCKVPVPVPMVASGKPNDYNELNSAVCAFLFFQRKSGSMF